MVVDGPYNYHMSFNRFLTRLILLCVLPLLVLAVFLAAVYVYHVHMEHDAHADGVSKSLSAQIDQSLNARISGLQMLAASPLADDVTHWQSLYAEAHAFVRSFGSHVVFADTNLQMRFNTRVSFG